VCNGGRRSGSCEDGFIGMQTRWYAFQFMMQELSDDLEAMHRCMATVLKMLPNALAARNG